MTQLKTLIVAMMLGGAMLTSPLEAADPVPPANAAAAKASSELARTQALLDRAAYEAFVAENG